MDVSWDYEIKDGQRSNPVVYSTYVDLPKSMVFPTESLLLKAFKSKSFKQGSSRLKTWGRAKDKSGAIIYEDDPHWIAVRNGTPLHMDPPYPRYSHHLKIRADEGMFVRGLDRVELKLITGVFYILDTHSPHQVFNKSKSDKWNVAVSIDSNRIWNHRDAIDTCVDFGINSSFLST